jgi:hypothetical protein
MITMKKFKFILLAAVLTGLSLPSYGQDAFFAQPIGSFFISIIAGILLAFAFQFLLTNLAVASGITAIGDIREKGNSSGSSKDNSSGSSSDKDSDSFTGVKISSGVGLFMLITMSISLFFASFLAVRLSMIPYDFIGIVLGLVIWAGFLILGLWIDAKMISSLAGSFFSAVKSALGTGATAVGGLFTPGPASIMKDTAETTVKTIHDEIRQEYDLSGFQSKLEEYINKLEPQKIDYDKIQESLVSLINEIELKEQYTPGDPDATKRIFLEVASQQKGLTKKDKKKLSDTYSKVREAMQKEGTRSEKAVAAAEKLMPGGEKQAKEYRQKVAQYLKKTGKEEIQPKALESDLNQILNNPKAAPEVIEARIEQLDRETLKAMILATDGMKEEEVDNYLDRAEKVIENIREKARESGSRAGSLPGEIREGAREMTEEMRRNTENAVREWFNRMDREELQYEKLKHDVQMMMDDPQATPEILRNRLERMDRESLIALLSNNEQISHDQAERIVSKVEEARDTVITKSREIEEKVKQKLSDAKDEALRQAEGARKTAAAAAWWLLGASVVSGAASAVGGILAF